MKQPADLGVFSHAYFGSTAVPGLAAKPAIDMIALVDDLDAPIAPLVQHGGYQYPQAFNATLTHRRFLCYPTAVQLGHQQRVALGGDPRVEFGRVARLGLERGFAPDDPLVVDRRDQLGVRRQC